MRVWNSKQIVGGPEEVDRVLDLAHKGGWTVLSVAFAGIITERHHLSAQVMQAPSFLIVAYRDEGIEIAN